MDYFLSSGATTSTEAINTIIMQPVETTLPDINIFSSLLDSLYQFIPAEVLSLVDLPVL
jgi:hypothetical protein